MYSLQHCKDSIKKAIAEEKLYAVRSSFTDIEMLHKLGQWRNRASEYLPKEKRLVFSPLGACLSRNDLEWIMNPKNFEDYNHGMHVDNMRAYYKAPFQFQSSIFMTDVTYVCSIIMQLRLRPMSYDPRAYDDLLGQQTAADPKAALVQFTNWLHNYIK
jgi:hypothetical protein